MAKREQIQPAIDKVIHERARLLILSFLAAGDQRKAVFTELKDKLELTSGNLSIQLRNLEEAGYVRIDKRIVGRKPVTEVTLTRTGLNALKEYLAEMEDLIRQVRTAGDVDGGE